jgi:hypothetical protein
VSCSNPYNPVLVSRLAIPIANLEICRLRLRTASNTDVQAVRTVIPGKQQRGSGPKEVALALAVVEIIGP